MVEQNSQSFLFDFSKQIQEKNYCKKIEDVIGIIVNQKIKGVYKVIDINELLSKSLQELIALEALKVIDAKKLERSENRIV